MIKGITFDEQSISSQDMAHFMRLFSRSQNGATRGCEISHDNNNIYISEGYYLIFGRQIRIVGTQTVPIVSISSGELYCTAVLQIDLSKTNTETEFIQGTIETVTSSSGYPALTQEDLEANLLGLYQYPIASYHVTVSGIDSFIVKSKEISADWVEAGEFEKLFNENFEKVFQKSFDTAFDAKFTKSGENLYIS